VDEFGYDLWGDAVITASRMESHAPPGAIQVAERTYRLLGGDFDFERRTGVPVKGKGDMTIYILLAERPETELPLAAAGSEGRGLESK